MNNLADSQDFTVSAKTEFRGNKMYACIDKLEIIMIKCLIIVGIALIFSQAIIQHSGWSDFLVLLNRLEGTVYTYGGWQ